MGPAADTDANSVSLEALAHPTLGELLASPGLWIGLAIALAFVAGAVRVRRSREPM